MNAVKRHFSHLGILIATLLALFLIASPRLATAANADESEESLLENPIREQLNALADQWDGTSRTADAAVLRMIAEVTELATTLESIYLEYKDIPSLPTAKECADEILSLVEQYYTPSVYYKAQQGYFYKVNACAMIERCYRAVLIEHAFRLALEDAASLPENEAHSVFLREGVIDPFELVLLDVLYEVNYVKRTNYEPMALAAEETVRVLCEALAKKDASPKNDDLNAYLIRAYISVLEDRFASYYTPKEALSDEIDELTNYVGIGVVVSLSEEGLMEILYVMKDSPAEAAGLLAGDMICEVDGDVVSESSYSDILDSIRGESGTPVLLSYMRDGQKHTVTAYRGNVVNQTVMSRLIEEDGKKLGYVRITSFSSGTYAQFVEAVTTLEELGAEAFIFDMRDNPGGLLRSVLQILSYILPDSSEAIPDGTLVRLQYRTRSFSYTTADFADDHEITVPITVLCNKSTVSAAELFTSTLKDWDYARIIGVTTYGKGVGQSEFWLSGSSGLTVSEGACTYGSPLESNGVSVVGSKLYLTTFYYSPPISGNYDGIGITPHLIADLPEEYQGISLYKLTYDKDTVLRIAVRELVTGTLTPEEGGAGTPTVPTVTSTDQIIYGVFLGLVLLILLSSILLPLLPRMKGRKSGASDNSAENRPQH